MLEKNNEKKKIIKIYNNILKKYMFTIALEQERHRKEKDKDNEGKKITKIWK